MTGPNPEPCCDDWVSVLPGDRCDSAASATTADDSSDSPFITRKMDLDTFQRTVATAWAMDHSEFTLSTTVARVVVAALAARDARPSVAAMVAEFHRRPGVDCQQPAAPTLDVPGASARLDYIEEEVRELREAVEAGDLIAAADALADMAYVVYGAAWRFGVDLDPVIAEVHRSNMTKTPTPGDGKAVKGPGYSPPDVAGALEGRTQVPAAAGDAELRQLREELDATRRALTAANDRLDSFGKLI